MHPPSLSLILQQTVAAKAVGKHSLLYDTVSKRLSFGYSLPPSYSLFSLLLLAIIASTQFIL